MTTVPRRQNLEHPRTLRLERQSNRGKVIVTPPGVNTVRRRTAFDLIINSNNLTNVNVRVVRDRMRKGWTMGEALTTGA
jgi:hypothetical protein